MRAGILGAAVFAAAAVLFSAVAAPAAGSPTTTVTDVPVHGEPVPIQQGRSSQQPVGYAAVHAVRRIDGGTVLYYSVGWPKDAAGQVQAFSMYPQITPGDRWAPVKVGIAMQRLVDPVGLHSYLTLAAADNAGCICSDVSALPSTAGTMHALYQVFPELPPETTAVDVWLGFGSVVADVPVEDGPLEPAVPGGQPIPLGTGWPQVDVDAVTASPEVPRSVRELEERSTSLDGTTTTTETSDQVSIDVSSDVLFAVDSADLSTEATRRIADVAETLNERAAAGDVAVTGHTDSTGSDKHNDDLSRRRAEAVAAALKPLLTVPDVKLVVEGRGEREPVADNSTEAGRQENRRVTVSFTPKG
jgi:outer membrane protein OmpA-like peptidoglycan-associated protein